MADQDYEAARCPICMEPPHNAVVLICSSHDQGCRALLCDTGSNLSNCLSEFISNLPVPLTLASCPLCRGLVSDYTDVESAGRNSMNAMSRSCPHESCDFTRNYTQLVQHASQMHPSVNPLDVDESRLMEWASLEEQEWGNTDDSPILLSPSEVPISHLRVILAIEQLIWVVGGRATILTWTDMPLTDAFARGVMAGTTLNWEQGIGPIYVSCYRITPYNDFGVRSEIREPVSEDEEGVDDGYDGLEQYYIRRHTVILEWQD